MHVTFVPGTSNRKGFLQIDEARIVWRNFSGAPSKYNREGDRNFALVIPNEEIADALANDKNQYGVGWNVKVRPPRNEDEDPFRFLPVKVKFNDKGPNIYLKTGNRMNRLDEESVACLDDVEIANVDLDIRPHDSEVNGKPFRSAYLKSICVTQNIDRFAARYAEEEYPGEEPF